MRTAISVISLLGAVSLLAYLVFKTGTLTIGYIIGYGLVVFMAFTSGMAIKKIEDGSLQKTYEALKSSYAQLEQRFNKLAAEYSQQYEAGKASAPTP